MDALEDLEFDCLYLLISENLLIDILNLKMFFEYEEVFDYSICDVVFFEIHNLENVKTKKNLKMDRMS